MERLLVVILFRLAFIKGGEADERYSGHLSWRAARSVTLPRLADAAFAGPKPL
jgi:hypothetical protein